MLESIGWCLVWIVVICMVMSALQILLFVLEVLCWSWFPEFSVRFAEFRWDVYIAWRKMWKD